MTDVRIAHAAAEIQEIRHLRVVAGGIADPKPRMQQEAEGMRAIARTLRTQALRLPAGNESRERWLELADGWHVAGQVRWPESRLTRAAFIGLGAVPEGEVS